MSQSSLNAPSHVALVVPSVRNVAEKLKLHGFEIGPEEIFESEGTKEIYVEYGKANSLLLMEPIKPGPYKNALEKRGPGIHHFAIDVPDLKTFLDSLLGTGWFIHPVSIRTMEIRDTAYLARPGFPALIEVHEKKIIPTRPIFVTNVSLHYPQELEMLPKAIGLDAIIIRSSREPTLMLNQVTLELTSLVR